MDLLPLARAARTTLRTCLEAAHAHLEHGTEIPKQIRDLAESSLNLLDFYLTESKMGCNRKPGELEVLWDGETVYVHLSDGGYSRIMLSLFGGPNGESQMYLDYRLSLPRVVARWDAITTPQVVLQPTEEG